VLATPHSAQYAMQQWDCKTLPASCLLATASGLMATDTSTAASTQQRHTHACTRMQTTHCTVHNAEAMQYSYLPTLSASLGRPSSQGSELRSTAYSCSCTTVVAKPKVSSRCIGGVQRQLTHSRLMRVCQQVHVKARCFTVCALSKHI
jgi:hypothetical protein